MKWFVMQNDNVTGPFSSDEVKAQVTGGQLPINCLIWGHPQTTWENLSWWLKESAHLIEVHQQAIVEQQWHYAMDGDSRGPFSRVELVNEIKGMRQKGEILIWTKGMKAWADLYEFHDILDEIGMNRREHPRANILGTVTILFDDKTIKGSLCAISPGGFGANTLNSNIAIGQLVTADLESSELNEKIRVKANVQYVSNSGYVGFKFVGINMEAKAIILDYVRSAKTRIAHAA